ncbi:Benzaldehyde dehydrogenase [Cupriavidus necator]|nr:hypothetical protein ASL20_25440 [Cupriavidus necator]
MTNSNSCAWEGRIFSNGWVPGTGSVADVVEPSTGKILATIGIGLADDIDRAANAAQRAQPGWASTSFDKRAEILREAARLLKARADEINGWNVREYGSTAAKAEWELHATYEQLLMAAAMPMQPEGALYASAMPGRMNIPQAQDVARAIRQHAQGQVDGLVTYHAVLTHLDTVAWDIDPQWTVLGQDSLLRPGRAQSGPF